MESKASKRNKWNDKEWRSRYNKQYREKQKLKAGAAGEKPLSTWKERVAKKLASQVRPLFLSKCPSCDSEFLRRINGKLEPMKLSSCSECDLRFYQAGGKVQ
jgi:hypothetical protein